MNRQKLALLGVAAAVLVLAVSWAGTEWGYCLGRFEAPATPLQQFVVPACGVGRDVIELNDVGARVIVDGQRLYLLDVARPVTVATEYRIDRGALTFTSKVIGHSLSLIHI